MSHLSKNTKLVAGITLLAVPTIMYGGITLLGLLMDGAAGLTPGSMSLDETQSALWRAGHAHAGVWMIFSLILQILIDGIDVGSSLEWTARITAPLSAVLTSAGFFGLAFLPGFQWLLYIGGICLLISVIVTGIGLLKNRG